MVITKTISVLSVAMNKISVLSVALALSIAVPAVAQVRTAYPDKRGLKLSEFPRVIKLADNVYGYEEIRQPGFTTVSLFVVGNDGVLIADGQGSPAATQTMLDISPRSRPSQLSGTSSDPITAITPPAIQCCRKTSPSSSRRHRRRR